jgi:hypothetical protein
MLNKLLLRNVWIQGLAFLVLRFGRIPKTSWEAQPIRFDIHCTCNRKAKEGFHFFYLFPLIGEKRD